VPRTGTLKTAGEKLTAGSFEEMPATFRTSVPELRTLSVRVREKVAKTLPKSRTPPPVSIIGTGVTTSVAACGTNDCSGSLVRTNSVPA